MASDLDHCRSTISQLLRSLNERETTIIRRRFGLSGGDRTLRQIGTELGISTERVRQIECRASRSSGRSRGLEDFNRPVPRSGRRDGLVP